MPNDTGGTTATTTASLTDDAFARFVRRRGGRIPIRMILIANNGIAAVKAIRSIRVWTYETFGDERSVEFVAMATPEDVAANAEYVRMADIWTEVPGGSNNNNFANVDLIADIADRYACDAVWAGWGHASENPALPRKLAALGIAFMGPPARSMHALGDKIASTIIAQSANVPCVAWSGSGLFIHYKELGCVPDDVYASACVKTADDALHVADECGYPVVIKASEGGGGKGIRVVYDKSALQPAFRQVEGEIPGSPIFVMQLVKNARHLEVQIVADEYGNAVALHGRDCSIQRRHQKIIEEGPVVAAPPAIWKKLEQGAVALAKEVGYVGAGTVEYLYLGDEAGGEFYFLELNPRLQVEHPVTEWISRINLPALQLHIAMGIPLQNVSCIRAFFGADDLAYSERGDALSSCSAGSPPTSPEAGGLSGDGSSAGGLSSSGSGPGSTAVAMEEIGKVPAGSELLDGEPLPPRGHVIACRITAENPDEGFQPTSGAIQELMFRNTPNVWGYFSVGASGGVHEFADSQFGHLFAWGENREASRRSLVLALKELSIRGDIRTTVEYIIKLLEMADFRENKIHTAWLDGLIAEKVTAERPPQDLAVVLGAVCRAHIDLKQRADAFINCLERGQFPVLDRSLVDFPVELIFDDVKYSLHVTRAGVSSFRVKLANGGKHGESIVADVRKLADDGILILVDGRSHVCYAHEDPTGMRLSIDGKTCLSPHEYDPETLSASVSGKLIRFLIEDGDHVEKDHPYAELEVMKMYLTLQAPESGIISLVKPPGSALELGDVVARLKLDDPSKVRRAELFDGSLPNFGPPQAAGSKPHQIFNAARESSELLLRGFDGDSSSLNRLIELIDDPAVAAGELQEALSSLSGRIPEETFKEIEAVIQSIAASCAEINLYTEGRDETELLDEVHSSDVKAAKFLYRNFDLSGLSNAVAVIKKCLLHVPQAVDLLAVAAKYEDGSVLAPTICSLLDVYLDVERPFARSSLSPGDVLFAMRDANRKDLSSLMEVAASHVQLKAKTEMMVKFLQVLSHPTVNKKLSDESAQTIEVKARLHQLSQLFAPSYADVAMRARIMLAEFSRPQFQQRHRIVAQMLAHAASVPASQRQAEIQKIVCLSESMLDVIVTFVLPADDVLVPVEVRRIAAEVQLLRSYRAYEVSQFIVALDESEPAPLMATWRFRFSTRLESLNGSQSVSPTSSQAPPGMLPASGASCSSGGMTRMLSTFDSADNLSRYPGGGATPLASPESETYRYGALAAFSNLEEMESTFDSVFQRCTSQIDSIPGLDVNVMTVLLRWDATVSSLSTTTKLAGDVPKSLKDPLAFEEHVSGALREFCRAEPSRLELAKSAGLKTITFIVAPAPSGMSTSYPGFYTFRVRDGFSEDPIYRHIDPPMAFQLELARLSNFDITRFGYPNRSIHVFYAQDKAATKRRRTGTPPKHPVTGPSSLVDFQSSSTAPDESKAPIAVSKPGEDVALAKGVSLALPLNDAASTSLPLPPASPCGASKKLLSVPAGENEVTQSPGAITSEGLESSSRNSRPASRSDRDVDARFFVRAVIRHVDVFSSANDAVVQIPEAERTFVEALDAVEMASCDRRFRRTDCNHVFINVIPMINIAAEEVQKVCKKIFMRYARRCWTLRVFVVEVKVSTFSSGGTNSAAFLPLRFLLFNPTGHMLRVESYLESTDPATGSVRIVSLSRSDQGSLHGTAVSEPYQIMDRMQRNRVVAKTIETVYVYDFVQLFNKQLQARWRQYSEDRLLGGFRRHKMPSTFVKATELVLGERPSDADGEGPFLFPTDRLPGLNDIGMVAWRCTMFTPACPAGRDLIIIANDITFRSGSFGTEEDDLFLAASRLAREEGIPRIYLAANAGARIGIAEEVRDRLQVIWNDPSDPLKGFSGLAVAEEDLAALRQSVVTGRELSPGLFEVETIIGATHGIGVENLMGSGLIAGETSLAYEEIFTLTYVTARSVGIGAYLVRLGQRVIQKETAAPIILTGYSALNKVLGHDVYVSNDQLGGTKIMHPNGVTHTVVQDDVQGVSAILDWLSFVPSARGQPLPVIESRDPVTREIHSGPPADGQSYDPRRKLIGGETVGEKSDGAFLCGFFDKYSWRESLEGWAKTVVVGRARLGGVPTGVIAVETRSVERLRPADPASPETREEIVQQAGQVWYPDSAAKTAQAIRDLDREGLPLFIFANWRGFSGGMRDMFDEVLKAGSEIVDALRAYKQPVFVYIPPGGELRGGAWVVLDTLINPEKIEMYADSSSRGGILEPEGTVDVKYRRRDLLKTMHRLDPVLVQLDKELHDVAVVQGLGGEDERKKIYMREAEILPAYKGVATAFCDLHDTPQRLVTKGAIRKVVEWKKARTFFYWRLQRRLSEDRVRGMCQQANSTLTYDQISSLLRKWADADRSLEAEASIGSEALGSSPTLQDSIGAVGEDSSSIFDTNDRWVYQWFEVEEDSIVERVSKLRVARVAEEVKELSQESTEGFLEGIAGALQSCTNDSERAKLVAAIQARVEQAAGISGARSLLPPSLLSRLRVGFDYPSLR